MKKTLTALLATSALMIAAPAFSADATYESKTTIKRDDDGSMTKETSAVKTDAHGKVSSEVKADVDVDGDGNTEKTVTTKDVNDPKGLFNKNTVKTEQTSKLKDGKLVVESEKTVNGKTVEEHSTEKKSSLW